MTMKMFVKVMLFFFHVTWSVLVHSIGLPKSEASKWELYAHINLNSIKKKICNIINEGWIEEGLVVIQMKYICEFEVFAVI